MCVYATKTTHREPDRRGPRTEEPELARVAGTTGRAGSGEQRRRRVGEACLHPVDQAESPGAGGGVEPPARLQFENCTTRSGVRGYYSRLPVGCGHKAEGPTPLFGGTSVVCAFIC